MGKKLSPDQMELYRRTDEVLHYLWDPIGVAGAPGARDEYETYVPSVFGLLVHGADERRLAEHLLGIERERMGLTGDPSNARRIAEILLEYRTWISSHPS